MTEHWTLAKANELTPLKLAAMSEDERARLAQFYQNTLRLRVASYARAGVEPYAFTKLERDFEKANSSRMRDRIPGLFEQIVRSGKLTDSYNNLRDPSATVNQYIYRMRTFFASKSSSVAGWRDVAKQQDIQLFGAEYKFRNKYIMEQGEDGKRHRVYVQGAFVDVIPKGTLSDSDRRKLWAIIDLAKDAGFMNVFGYNSDQVHRELASMYKNGEFSVDDIDTANDKILKMIAKKQGLEDKYEEHSPGNSGDVFRRTGVEGGEDNVW